jgi:hypothetical protein
MSDREENAYINNLIQINKNIFCFKLFFYKYNFKLFDIDKFIRFSSINVRYRLFWSKFTSDINTCPCRMSYISITIDKFYLNTSFFKHIALIVNSSFQSVCKCITSMYTCKFSYHARLSLLTKGLFKSRRINSNIFFALMVFEINLTLHNIKDNEKFF